MSALRRVLPAAVAFVVVGGSVYRKHSTVGGRSWPVAGRVAGLGGGLVAWARRPLVAVTPKPGDSVRISAVAGRSATARSCSPAGAAGGWISSNCACCSHAAASPACRMDSGPVSGTGRLRRRTIRARSSRRRSPMPSATRSRRPTPARTCSRGGDGSWTTGPRTSKENTAQENRRSVDPRLPQRRTTPSCVASSRARAAPSLALRPSVTHHPPRFGVSEHRTDLDRTLRNSGEWHGSSRRRVSGPLI